MSNRYDYGVQVRLTRNVRNDGTYPGEEVGALLVRRGEIGTVYDVGTYLQDQIIYRVHFLAAGRTVGCRQEELISADDPWIANRFEFREKVVAVNPLAIKGEVVVSVGDEGEIEKVIKDEENARIFYHARFHGRVFYIPETSLDDVKTPNDIDTMNDVENNDNGKVMEGQ